MAKKGGSEGVSALQFLPARVTMTSLREAARKCQGCPLFQNATQTVFGQGERSARVLFVGEQPGHDEDLKGKPFVGPAGRILDQALATVHPSSILRQPTSEDRRRAMDQFVADLKVVAGLLNGKG